MTLDKLKYGHSGVIIGIDECGNRRRLLEMGFVPGTLLTAGRCSPFKDPCEVLIRGYSLTLRRDDLKAVRVQEVSR